MIVLYLLESVWLGLDAIRRLWHIRKQHWSGIDWRDAVLVAVELMASVDLALVAAGVVR